MTRTNIAKELDRRGVDGACAYLIEELSINSYRVYFSTLPRAVQVLAGATPNNPEIAKFVGELGRISEILLRVAEMQPALSKLAEVLIEVDRLQLHKDDYTEEDN